MNTEEFRKHGKDVVDYICDYTSNIHKRKVGPTIEPGFLKPLLPDEAPVKGEKFEDIMKDLESKLMPGVLHWTHPKFFAYFPSGTGYPSMLGDLLSAGLGLIVCSWGTSPAATELENIVLDWFAKALGLPKEFISDQPGSQGGGTLQGSASECIFVCMLAARARAIDRLKETNKNTHDSELVQKLVAYCSKDAHSSVEKSGKMSLVHLRMIDSDDHSRIRVDLLRKAIKKDVEAGLTPFFVLATTGTTNCCAFDDLTAVGKVCQEFPDIWFHVDGAYAGNAFILPEMRVFSKGLEYADSFNTNPNKLLLVNLDASAMWVKDVKSLTSALTVNPLYMEHNHKETIDYRHYGISLSRRFRSLKLWFIFRSYGISGLQAYMRNHFALAKKFEALVRKDDRFEVANDVHVGLVCFRLRGEDGINRELLGRINRSGQMHLTPAMVNGKFIIRFCICYEHATEEHVREAWSEIQDFATGVLRDNKLGAQINGRCTVR